jgi:hypothetical protein
MPPALYPVSINGVQNRAGLSSFSSASFSRRVCDGVFSCRVSPHGTTRNVNLYLAETYLFKALLIRFRSYFIYIMQAGLQNRSTVGRLQALRDRGYY